MARLYFLNVLVCMTAFESTFPKFNAVRKEDNFRLSSVMNKVGKAEMQAEIPLF